MLPELDRICGGEQLAGEPGFEPGFTVLETARITINSLPWGEGDGIRPRGEIRSKRLVLGASASSFRGPDCRCGRRDSNPQEQSPPAPKAGASTNFATPAEALSVPDSSRSEEHTSELQSLRHLVCRL